jgi:hypothetical protein
LSQYRVFDDYPRFGFSQLAPRAGHVTDDFNKRVIWLGALDQKFLNDGTLLFTDPIFLETINRAEKFPMTLFNDLDTSWQDYAGKLDQEGIALRIPPVLGIVLTRCAHRDAIPGVLFDLRNEWKQARKKVWDLLDSLRSAGTLDEGMKIHRDLTDASKLFSPNPTDYDSRPVRVLWEIVTAATAGAGIAILSGGKPLVGAITGAMAHVPRSVPALLHEFGPAVFGHGAFDLARRVRRAASEIEVHALARLLSDVERRKLGF